MSAHVDYDYVVVGAGINGTWAAYHLAKRGFRALLLEQFSLPHSRGSSQGQTRIIRTSYPEKYFKAMAEDCYGYWHTLMAETGTTDLIQRTGFLVFGPPSGDFLSRVVENFAESPKDKEENAYEIFADGKQIERRFPALRCQSEDKACFEVNAGVMKADKALATCRAHVRALGCTILDSFPVHQITPRGENLVQVRGADGRAFLAKGVIVTTGAWANNTLKPLGLSWPLQPLKVLVCYFRKVGPFLPCAFLMDGPRGSQMYGMPEMEYPGLVKVGLHYGLPCNPDHRDEKLFSEETDILARLKAFVTSRFPGLDPEPVIVEPCMYTMTPDESPIIDFHPSHKNIVVASGFSGTGFKLGPITGEIVSEMVVSGSLEGVRYDMTPFRASRFSQQQLAKL